jgi:glyoxylase-like metal-dependent hydrolase (beta-lactamase superfamily II)
MNRRLSTKYFQVTQRVWGTKLFFVNVYMIANRPGTAKGWVLVDAGIKGSAEKICAMAEEIFGPGTRPQAIILTHAHSDHAGSLEEILKMWDVPVYAHELEIPYLKGLSSYPPVDPFAGGGLMSLASVLFPSKPLNVRKRIRVINVDEGIPELPEWKVIPTPGHSPGHISLFWPVNSTLIAGDAVATTQTESAISVMGYIKKLSGPPKYITMNWQQAEESVKTITELNPRTLGAGHGPAMRGRELHDALQELADNFKTVAVPKNGRYVAEPAVTGAKGVEHVPPFKTGPSVKLLAGLSAAVLCFFVVKTLAD